MILKIFKAVWFLSLLACMAVFFYIYASLPETVLVGEWQPALYASRDTVFYATLALIALINTLVFAFMKAFGPNQEHFSTWFFGQIILLNFFFSIAIGFVNLLNSGEKFAYERLGVIIYGSVILIIIWALSWPIYSVSRKVLNKPAV